MTSLKTQLEIHTAETNRTMKKQQKEVEKIQNTDDVKALNNKFEQERLKLDITAFGIPSLYHERPDEIIDSLNRTFALTLDRKSFRRIYTMNKNKKDQCTLKMKFMDMRDKARFMKAVEEFSVDDNKKWKAITVKDIFDECKSPSHPLSDKSITFVNSLTPTNQEIIKMKKNVGECIIRERDGVISIRKDKNSNPVEVNSVEEVKKFVARNQECSPEVDEDRNLKIIQCLDTIINRLDQSNSRLDESCIRFENAFK
jgi:hypothetical protein